LEQVDNEPLVPNGTEVILGLSILLSVMQLSVTHAEWLSVYPVDLRLHLPELDFGTGNRHIGFNCPGISRTVLDF